MAVAELIRPARRGVSAWRHHRHAESPQRRQAAAAVADSWRIAVGGGSTTFQF